MKWVSFQDSSNFSSVSVAEMHFYLWEIIWNVLDSVHVVFSLIRRSHVGNGKLQEDSIRRWSGEKIVISFRFIWFVVIVLGAFCVVSMSCIISIRYKANYLTTVIDNTHHSVADIPFPAVTLCHYNRIDSRKVDAAIKKWVVSNCRSRSRCKHSN